MYFLLFVNAEVAPVGWMHLPMAAHVPGATSVECLSAEAAACCFTRGIGSS